ncbi:MAG: cob(I)yrinic acid a,c-diamide adenosyltransferase [Chromatiales bacterium]|nr:cob(I)yrinic acid a,c-diamide adenosyltransferase [Chromatiales bacterium]
MSEKTVQDKNDRHQARMARKKAIVDEKIRSAQQERGIVLVNTGNGKGKSSAAFGVLARALGHDMKAGVIQFIKGSGTTGEERFFSAHPNVDYHVMGDGFTWETQNREQDIASATKAWQKALQMLQNPELGLVIFDELNIVLKERYLTVETVIEGLSNRPPMQHVIITGRGAPAELIDFADTVTEMGLQKHAFQSGIKAQPGVEF